LSTHYLNGEIVEWRYPVLPHFLLFLGGDRVADAPACDSAYNPAEAFEATSALKKVLPGS